MADLVLVLDENADTTMPTVGQVRRVSAPAGSRTLIVSSDTPFWWETPAAAKADGDAITAGRSLYHPAGMYAVKLTPNVDGYDVAAGKLRTATFFYFHPTEADQIVSFRADSIG